MKFEYLVLHNKYESPESDAFLLNTAGKLGWELVSILNEGSITWFYMKRELSDTKVDE